MHPQVVPSLPREGASSDVSTFAPFFTVSAFPTLDIKSPTCEYVYIRQLIGWGAPEAWHSKVTLESVVVESWRSLEPPWASALRTSSWDRAVYIVTRVVTQEDRKTGRQEDWHLELLSLSLSKFMYNG